MPAASLMRAYVAVGGAALAAACVPFGVQRCRCFLICVLFCHRSVKHSLCFTLCFAASYFYTSFGITITLNFAVYSVLRICT
jgi:hypothetical protein